VKILILKPSSLGDVVQALPVLRLLKLHWPDSRIYWWVDAALAPLLEHDPDLAGIVRFERRRWRSPRFWPEVFDSIRWMRAQRFDLVIDLQSLARSGTFAWLANGSVLAGLDDAREGARGYYDIIVSRPGRLSHAVDWYLSLLPVLGVPVHSRFDWLPPRAAAADVVRKKRSGSGPLIALQPGARWENKRWPAEYFAAVVRKLAAIHPQHTFIVLGGIEDRPLAAEIVASAPGRCLNLAGEATLPEMVEWIRSSDLMISNDTGPMHVAAAVKTPVLAIFGPTEPRRTGPYGQLDHVLQTNLYCVPCMSSHCGNPRRMECLFAIDPSEVVARAAAALGRNSTGPVE
jgi:heptosyltransferase-1